MSIDIFGDLFGKARRRELEGQVKLNFSSLGKRLAVGAVAAGIAAAANPGLLGTKSGVLSLIGIGLTAMIPAGAASAGLVSPTQPGSPSVTEALVQAAVNVASAPADKRQAAATALETQTEAKIQAGVEAGLQKLAPVLLSQAVSVLNKTGQYSRGETGGSAVLQDAPETPVGDQTGIAASDAAIASTGGNQ